MLEQLRVVLSLNLPHTVTEVVKHGKLLVSTVSSAAAFSAASGYACSSKSCLLLTLAFKLCVPFSLYTNRLFDPSSRLPHGLLRGGFLGCFPLGAGWRRVVAVPDAADQIKFCGPFSLGTMGFLRIMFFARTLGAPNSQAQVPRKSLQVSVQLWSQRSGHYADRCSRCWRLRACDQPREVHEGPGPMDRGPRLALLHVRRSTCVFVAMDSPPQSQYCELSCTICFTQVCSLCGVGDVTEWMAQADHIRVSDFLHAVTEHGTWHDTDHRD